MHIDRSNYEQWFIDWLDGNLNSLQAEQLKLFVEKNPDLREELNDLSAVNLVPSGILFPYKEQLKKSPSEISWSQFEYLCAAYLENDLSSNQKKELEDIINADPDRKKKFDLIQKTIIAPPGISYRHKKRLLRRSHRQNVIRISAIGLSAAAAISIFIIIYPIIPGTSTLKQINTAQNSRPDSSVQRLSQVLAEERIITESVPVPAEKKRDKRLASVNRKENIVTNPDSSLIIIDKQEDAVIKVPVNLEVDLGKGIVSHTLIASGTTITIPDAEDERSKAGRFILKTLREKILKEKTPADSPLKGYEIAEAGITGLNKLFGWQMALNMENDEKGQPKAVKFSSGILKIQAPVKKRKVQP